MLLIKVKIFAKSPLHEFLIKFARIARIDAESLVDIGMMTDSSFLELSQVPTDNYLWITRNCRWKYLASPVQDAGVDLI